MARCPFCRGGSEEEIFAGQKDTGSMPFPRTCPGKHPASVRTTWWKEAGKSYTKDCGNQRAGTARSSQEPVAPAPGAEVSFAHARMRMCAGVGAKTPEPVVERPQPQNIAQKAPHLSPTCSLPAPLHPPLLWPLQPDVRPR